MLRFSLLFLIVSAWLTSAAIAQEQKLSQDPIARQQFMTALNALKTQLPEMPAVKDVLNAAKVSANDSLDTGGISGFISGIIPGDSSSSSAWVLAVAAHLHEDPTAWALGEVKPEGDYVITGLSTGSYIVMAGADGFFPQFYSHAYSVWEAVIVEVGANEITEGIDFFLEPFAGGEGSLAGTVTAGDTGEPLSGAQNLRLQCQQSFYFALDRNQRRWHVRILESTERTILRAGIC